MQNEGIFLVIEGSDGSGKSTQYRLLSERLKSDGYKVKEIKDNVGVRLPSIGITIEF